MPTLTETITTLPAPTPPTTSWPGACWPTTRCPAPAAPAWRPRCTTAAAPDRIETWREAWGLADTLMREGWRATETLAFCPECAPGADWEGEDY